MTARFVIYGVDARLAGLAKTERGYLTADGRLVHERSEARIYASREEALSAAHAVPGARLVTDLTTEHGAYLIALSLVF